MELILAAVLILFAMTWLVIQRTKDEPDDSDAPHANEW
jgi:hypothetical protein